MIHADFGTPEFERQYKLAKEGSRDKIKRTPRALEIGNAVDRRGYVYFAGSDEGPIKIGFTTRPKRRLRELANGQAEEVRMLAVVSGTISLERSLHHRWRHLHIRGEWFQRTADLESEINRMAVANQGLGFANKGQKNG